MKRLFGVRDNSNGKLAKDDGGTLWYGDKHSAKQLRDLLRGGKDTPMTHSVVRGPDHMGKHGINQKKVKRNENS